MGFNQWLTETYGPDVARMIRILVMFAPLNIPLLVGANFMVTGYHLYGWHDDPVPMYIVLFVVTTLSPYFALWIWIDRRLARRRRQRQQAKLGGSGFQPC